MTRVSGSSTPASAGSTIRCRGVPSGLSGKTVRRHSWRATTSPSAAARASRSRAPVSRSAMRHVVRGGLGAFEPVEEPQPLLGEGQRQVRRAGPAGQHGAGAGRRRRGGAARPGDGRRLEQGAERQLHAEHGADPADQPGGEQGVAAEVEEVVVDADPVHAEDLGEQSRTASSSCAVRGARPCAARRRVGGGQGLAVELAVGGQRAARPGRRGGGHHVVAAAGRPRLSQRRPVRRSAPAAGTT